LRKRWKSIREKKLKGKEEANSGLEDIQKLTGKEAQVVEELENKKPVETDG